ncbi:MFS transporter [Rhizobium sp. CFBP 8762]|uniref:MFS transporter n=1 Tax=Rhizobium sp. CFBP 8762 TaxID=2775279 RepID=UPI00177C1EFF|nr:MFS transporter [Rhizobium sp. CFBP 8762]MBD8555184.1 MFS transporter [Rhizobium sp. CFBP 8762]
MTKNKLRQKRKITRDFYTVYLYFMMAILGYNQSILGSIMPFLRYEMNMSKAEIGWHFSSYAAGLFVAPYLNAWLFREKSATKALVPSALVLVTTAALFSAPTYSMMLFLAFALGVGVGAVQISIQEAIASHHGENQSIAVTEAFVFGALGVFVGPLVIGTVSSFGFGWRETMFVPAILLGILMFFSRKLHLQHEGQAKALVHPKPTTQGKVTLPVLVLVGMILFGIATEWGIGFWGAQFLEEKLNTSPETGVTLMAVFFGGTVCGRILVSRLLAFFEVNVTLVAMIFLGGASVLALWAVPLFSVSMVALALAGMCLGNFFPLILATANEYAPQHTRAISAGATQAVGLALLTVPILLGQLSESIGLENALGLLSALPLLMLLMFAVATRMKTRLANS